MFKKCIFALLLSFTLSSCASQENINVTTNLSETKKETICINTASETELRLVLTGVGDVKSRRIIASRKEAPFKNKYELVERGLIGDDTMKKIVKEVEIICNNN
ncbi:MAG: ComEA family DNA-binding protein [Paraclostridium sp.]